MRTVRLLVRVVYPASLAMVALACLVPKLPEAPVDIAYLDKIEHCLAFLVVGALGTSFFSRSGARRLGAAAASIAVGMALGIAIEIVQPYVGRSRELVDGLADLVGLLVGSAILLAATRAWRRARPNRAPRSDLGES